VLIHKKMCRFNYGLHHGYCIIFHLFLLFSAMATMYVRFKLVQAFNNDDRSLRILNKVALFMGALSSLGLFLVANFQVSCCLT